MDTGDTPEQTELRRTVRQPGAAARTADRVRPRRPGRRNVVTGEGRACSAGGDFDLLHRMANDRVLRRDAIAEGRELVLNMIRCRVPVVAEVDGPTVGLGCSVIALSDGLANHVCPGGEVLSAALPAAHEIAALPRRAAEATRRVLNLHVERAILATVDFAMASETESFDTAERRESIDRFPGR